METTNKSVLCTLIQPMKTLRQDYITITELDWF